MSRFARKSKPSREELPKIHCFVEGSKTELNYLEKWNTISKKKTIIAIHTSRTDPNNIVAAAIKKQQSLNNDERDQFWVIFDTENSQNPRKAQIPIAVKAANQANIKLAISNPCFEYWLLLHATNHTAPIHNQNGVLALLQKSYPNYKKGDRLDLKFFDAANVQHAIARAGTIEKNHQKNSPTKNIYSNTPYTGMHHLIGSII